MRTFKIFPILALVLFGVMGLMALRQRAAEVEPEIAVDEPIVIQPAVAAGAPVELPDANRMNEFFNTGMPRLPIVETVTYSPKVSWLPGKSAWVENYASYFSTSRHMIARSLNGCSDYESQQVSNGDRFNVFAKDKPVSFHLVVDVSRARMWVYYLDESAGTRTLVKSYPVGLGRADSKRASGFLTPLGTYDLGQKIAVYRPGMTGLYNKEPIEMVQIFGTRWIPFDGEIEGCTAPSRGLGLHGCPWITKSGELVEDRSGLGTFESDGCIRLATEDMEELFSVIITKPARIYLVRDFFDAKLPGKEGS